MVQEFTITVSYTHIAFLTLCHLSPTVLPLRSSGAATLSPFVPRQPFLTPFPPMFPVLTGPGVPPVQRLPEKGLLKMLAPNELTVVFLSESEHVSV